MNRIIFPVAAMAALFTAASCNKSVDSTIPATSGQHTPAHKTTPVVGKGFVSWDDPCGARKKGTCLDEIVVAMPRKLTGSITIILSGDQGKIRALFTENHEALCAEIPAMFVDGVIDGSLTISDHASEKMRVHRFAFGSWSSLCADKRTDGLKGWPQTDSAAIFFTGSCQGLKVN